MDGPSPKKKAKKPTSSRAKDFTSSFDSSSIPPCKYGENCYRENLLHFAEYSHPTLVTLKVDDTDPMSDDHDDDDAKDSPKKPVKEIDILKIGVLLVKNYSQMTEDERKEVIKKAFEAKKQLEEELEETKDEVEKKEEEPKNADDNGDNGDEDAPDPNKICDKNFLAEKATEAWKVKPSKVFKGEKITITGKMQRQQAEMYKLIEKHGGTKGTPASFTLLVASIGEYTSYSHKCEQAEDKGIPVLAEMYLYDCIIKKKMQKQEVYRMDVNSGIFVSI